MFVLMTYNKIIHAVPVDEFDITIYNSASPNPLLRTIVTSQAMFTEQKDPNPEDSYKIINEEIIVELLLFGSDGILISEEGPFNIFPTLYGAPTPTAIATATPASALDCPPGTYFAEVTNRCIPIAIEPTRESGGGNSCVDPGTCPSGWSAQNCACK